MAVEMEQTCAALEGYLQSYPSNPALQGPALAAMRALFEPWAQDLENPARATALRQTLQGLTGRSPDLDFLIGSFLFDVAKDKGGLDLALTALQAMGNLSPAALYDLFIHLQALVFAAKASFSTEAYFALRQGPLRDIYRAAFDAMPPAPPTQPKARGKRIAILVTHMNNPRVQGPSWDALELAYECQESYGCEVLLINCNFWLKAQARPVWPLRAYTPWNGPLQGMWPHRGKTIPYRVLPSPLATPDNLALFDAWMADFAPSLTLAIGDSNLYADRLALTHDVVTMHFAVDYPITLHARPSYHPHLPETAPALLDQAPPTAAAPVTLRPHYSLLGRLQTYPRDWLGLADDAFVFCLIGHRLHSEVTDACLAALEAICASAPRAVILFAGHFDRCQERLSQWKHLKDQARFIGHVADVFGLCRACDAFINPDRTGGGSSAVAALAAGIPVLTLARGDVFFAAGPAFSAHDWDDLARRGCALIQNPAVLHDMRAKAQARAAVLLDRRAVLRHLFNQVSFAI